MKRIVWKFYFLIMFCAGAIVLAGQNPSERGVLENEVFKILSQSNVDRRPEIEKVFALGDIYFQEKNYDKAIFYYLEGLKVNAWNLPYQIKAANLLHQRQRDEEAIEKAKLVYDFAEQENLIQQADTLLAELGYSVAEKTAFQPENDMVIMLIPIGDVNLYLLKEVANDLQNVLGIRYVTNDQLKIDPGRTDRPYATRYLERVYEDLKQKLPDSEFKDYRIKAGISILNLDQYENQKKLVLTVFKDAFPPERFTEFEEMLSKMENNGQYHANRLIQSIKINVSKPQSVRADRYIGVTSEDIYASDYNFLFGQAIGSYAVMSYHRFTADFNNAIPNRKTLRDRTLKQLISSSFLSVGIPRCSNPTCARAYPNSLEEHDRKDNKPCASCLEKWKKAVAINMD